MVPVTVVAAGPVVVTARPHRGHRRLQRRAVRLRRRRPASGQQAGDRPLRQGRASRRAGTSPSCAPTTSPSYEVGQELTAEQVFDAGAEVDVTGTSKGKGTAGVMKRHGFAGLGAGHGVHRKHRSPGSIGGCSTPGRVFRGLRMAGRMGNATVTTQNLTVHAVDADTGLLLIKGAVPGPKGGAGHGQDRRQEQAEG